MSVVLALLGTLRTQTSAGTEALKLCPATVRIAGRFFAGPRAVRPHPGHRRVQARQGGPATADRRRQHDMILTRPDADPLPPHARGRALRLPNGPTHVLAPAQSRLPRRRRRDLQLPPRPPHPARDHPRRRSPVPPAAAARPIAAAPGITALVINREAEVITLSATHMVPDPKLNLAREQVQIDFLREHLGPP